jgi:hypothetical protein
MQNFDDALLRNMYEEYRTPWDRLVSNPSTIEHFTREYAGRTGHQVEPASLAHHLLNLRKLGEAKGGLRRLRRGYNGRN